MSILGDVDVEIAEHGAESLAGLSDVELAGLLREAVEFARRASGMPPAAVALSDLLLFPIWREQSRRADLEEHARVMLDANGHEVFAGDDQNTGEWFGFCSCAQDALPPGPVASRAEAVEVAGRHAVEQGGRWAQSNAREDQP